MSRTSAGIGSSAANPGGMTTTTTHADHAPTPTTIDAEQGTTKLPRTVTIREAAELAGTTRDAIRGRVERGSLRSVLGSDGVRRIPVSELERAGLLMDHARDHVGDHGMGDVGGYHDSVAGVGVFVDALERLQAANVAAVERAVVAETRLMLEQRAASSVELELHEARARIGALEQQLGERLESVVAPVRRGWFGIARRRS